jgi:hypothetical protein
MCFYNVTAIHLAGSDTTVVRALRARETTLGPSIRAAKFIEKSVLLLQTKPWFLPLVSLHELIALMAVIELVWSPISVPALGENKNVVSATERIWVDGNRSKVDVRVFPRGLTSRRTVKVPLWKVLYRNNLLGEGLQGRGGSQLFH